MNAPSGFFLCSSGDLIRGHGSAVPIRPGYAHHHAHIKTGLELRATLRAGPYAWPGGYQMFFLLSDGESLCFDCARSEFKQIARAIRDRDTRNGWRIVGCQINDEDSSMRCAHCNKRIPSSYGEA